MLNKATQLLFAFAAIFCFTTPASCQAKAPAIHSPESYIETPYASQESGIYDSYCYMSVGTGPLYSIPNVGVGYRQRHAQFGWDTSLNFSVCAAAKLLNGHLAGHYYLNPTQKNSLYVGAGLMGSSCHGECFDSRIKIAPEFIFGKELTTTGENKHFIEIHVAIPTVWRTPKDFIQSYEPMLYVRYGIGF